MFGAWVHGFHGMVEVRHTIYICRREHLSVNLYVCGRVYSMLYIGLDGRNDQTDVLVRELRLLWPCFPPPMLITSWHTVDRVMAPPDEAVIICNTVHTPKEVKLSFS